MVLVDHQIKAAILNEVLGVEPYREELVNPNSLDITLSKKFSFQKGYEKTPINPYNERDVTIGWVEQTGPVIISPGQLILGSTVEYISLPRTICAELNGKSSLARLGLQNHQTGGWIDCGFSGQITLELFNAGKRPIVLIPNMPIGQLVFHETEEAENGYGDRKSSKYQGQKGPVGSRYYLNKL
jgi:dCTP deaminase